MLADIAKPTCAKEGVSDRVEDDVGIACPARPRECGTAIPPSIIGPSPEKAWTSKPIPVRGMSRAASDSARSKRRSELFSLGGVAGAADYACGSYDCELVVGLNLDEARYASRKGARRRTPR